MVVSMSVALIFHHTMLNLVFFETHNVVGVCFVTRMLVDYFGLVYGFLITGQAVNLFTKVVLIFKKIDHFPLKATLIAWGNTLSMFRMERPSLLHSFSAVTPALIVGFTYSNLYFQLTNE